MSACDRLYDVWRSVVAKEKMRLSFCQVENCLCKDRVCPSEPASCEIVLACYNLVSKILFHGGQEHAEIVNISYLRE